MVRLLSSTSQVRPKSCWPNSLSTSVSLPLLSLGPLHAPDARQLPTASPVQLKSTDWFWGTVESELLKPSFGVTGASPLLPLLELEPLPPQALSNANIPISTRFLIAKPI